MYLPIIIDPQILMAASKSTSRSNERRKKPTASITKARKWVLS